LRIRPVTPSDIEAVALCHLASWQRGFRGILSDPLLDGLTAPHFIQTWREILSVVGRTNLVAEDAHELIGFVSFGPYRRDLSSDPPGSDHDAEVYGLYVHPVRWRSGAGRLLFRSALEELRVLGFRDVKLWTMTANHLSRSFYQAQGLRQSERTRTSERSGERFEEVQYEISLDDARWKDAWRIALGS